MEAVDIRHIQDKFPEKNGGLKDLFDKGPQDRFFLVKFWVSCLEAIILGQVKVDNQSIIQGLKNG